MDKDKEKSNFLFLIKDFATSLNNFIAVDNKWTVKGFIDIYKNVYTISTDTKIISKILELHIIPRLLKFAYDNAYDIELATYQNWYPDITFISKKDVNIKFALDLKTTYIDEKNDSFCNGFTLGSHGEYFQNRTSKKNIQYSYNDYLGHYCLGVIYSREVINKIDETKIYSVNDIENIPSVISNFIFFAEEKWKIASDKSGSGNTANIGSIKKIEDILKGNGVFSKAGEEYFDDYWINFGKIDIPDGKGGYKKLRSFADYLKYRNLSMDLYNFKASKRKNDYE